MRVLIVEDEVLVAAELEWMVVDFGHTSVGSAVSRDEALALAASRRPELAFVDVCLADGPTGMDVARALIDAGVAVVFTTANPKRLPDDLAGAAGVIAKPYAPGAVRDALHGLAAKLRAEELPSRNASETGEVGVRA